MVMPLLWLSLVFFTIASPATAGSSVTTCQSVKGLSKPPCVVFVPCVNRLGNQLYSLMHAAHNAQALQAESLVTPSQCYEGLFQTNNHENLTFQLRESSDKCSGSTSLSFWTHRGPLEPSMAQLQAAAALLTTKLAQHHSSPPPASQLVIHMRSGDIWADHHPLYVQCPCSFYTHVVDSLKYVVESVAILTDPHTKHEHSCLPVLRDKYGSRLKIIAASPAADLLYLAAARYVLVGGVSSYADMGLLLQPQTPRHVFTCAWAESPHSDASHLHYPDSFWKSIKNQYPISSFDELPSTRVHRTAVLGYTDRWSPHAAQLVTRVPVSVQPVPALRPSFYTLSGAILLYSPAQLPGAMETLLHTYPDDDRTMESVLPSVIYVQGPVGQGVVHNHLAHFIQVISVEELHGCLPLQHALAHNVFRTTHLVWVDNGNVADLKRAVEGFGAVRACGHTCLPADSLSLQVYPTFGTA